MATSQETSKSFYCGRHLDFNNISVGQTEGTMKRPALLFIVFIVLFILGGCASSLKKQGTQVKVEENDNKQEYKIQKKVYRF